MRHTLVFKKIAHSRPPGENKLRDILNDFGLLFGRESSEPFCESLSMRLRLVREERWATIRSEVAYHFALPRQQNEIAIQMSERNQ